jgi:serine/threonine protein kinase
LTAPRLPSPGDSVGPYTLIRCLEGQVFEASGPEGERLALKLVPALGLDQPDADKLRERFLRETGVAVAVFHPNLAALLDADLEDGFGFVVSPMFEGESLASRVARGATFSDDEKKEIGLALESAVAALHEAGLSHRGIYPRNVMLVSLEGRDKVILLEPGGFVRRATTTDAQTRDEAAIYTLFTAPGSVAPASASSPPSTSSTSSTSEEPPPISAVAPSTVRGAEALAPVREKLASQSAKTVPPSTRSPQNDDRPASDAPADDGRSEPLELRPHTGVRKSIVEVSEPPAGGPKNLVAIVVVVGLLVALAAFLLTRLGSAGAGPTLPRHRCRPRHRALARSRPAPPWASGRRLGARSIGRGAARAAGRPRIRK